MSAVSSAFDAHSDIHAEKLFSVGIPAATRVRGHHLARNIAAAPRIASRSSKRRVRLLGRNDGLARVCHTLPVIKGANRNSSMTRITPKRLSQLDFIAEDISLAHRILCVTESGKPVSLDQAAFALRELERAAANLADYRGYLDIESASQNCS